MILKLILTVIRYYNMDRFFKHPRIVKFVDRVKNWVDTTPPKVQSLIEIAVGLVILAILFA